MYPTTTTPTTWSSRCSRCTASLARRRPRSSRNCPSSSLAGNVIPKKRYSGFFNTDLAERLVQLAPEKLLICGVATNVCVLHTTSDARNRDYAVEVYSDCVSGPDPEAHRWALSHCQRVLGAKVI